MGNQSTDTKLARRLQKRGKYANYSECLRRVQRVLARTDKTPKEIAAMIDAGDLDAWEAS